MAVRSLDEDFPTDHLPLLRWLIFSGVCLFGFVLAWHFGLFRLMLASDKTYISLVIVILYLLSTLYVTMAAAGLAVEFIFRALGWVPATRQAIVAQAAVSWNADTVLNLIFLALSAVLVWRFLRTGGPDMLKMMDRPSGHFGGHEVTASS